MKPYLALPVLAFLAAATSAHAQLVGVQFQGGGAALTSSQTAGLPALAQDNFNVITGNNVTDAPLVGSDGKPVNDTLTVATSDDWSTSTGTSDANHTLLSGKIGAGYGSSGSFTLSKLAPGTYDLVVFTENNNEDNVGTYAVTGDSTVYATADQDGTDFDGSFVRGTNTTDTVAAAEADIANYVEFDDVTVGSGGTLTLTATQMAGAYSGVGGADFSGFQLQTVSLATPEPASWALLGGGLAGLFLAVRRRSAS